MPGYLCPGEAAARLPWSRRSFGQDQPVGLELAAIARNHNRGRRHDGDADFAPLSTTRMRVSSVGLPGFVKVMVPLQSSFSEYVPTPARSTSNGRIEP